MNDLKNKIKKFAEERDWLQFNTPENLAKSISIESAELLECYQWNSNANIDEVKEELADVLNYALRMCERLDLDPEQIVLDKMEKTRLKYPIDKCKGKSDKYTKL